VVQAVPTVGEGVLFQQLGGRGTVPTVWEAEQFQQLGVGEQFQQLGVGGTVPTLGYCNPLDPSGGTVPTPPCDVLSLSLRGPPE